MMKDKIYLDNNATTFCDPRVVKAMADHLALPYGNPSSTHAFGQKAKALILNAQRIIANHIGCKPSSIVFTSGGTESLNYCLRGLCLREGSGHVLTSNLEHAAVDTTLGTLTSWEIERLPGGAVGAVSAEAFENAIRPETRLLAVIAANNETGVKSDLLGIAEVAAKHGIPLLIDGVAWLGKERIPNLPGKVMWCFSAHKIHGPTGIGMVVLPAGVKLEPIITGGPQQQGRRGGTENLPGIVGFAEAIVCLEEAFDESVRHMASLRDGFERQILSELAGVSVNGEGERICNTTNLAFDGVDGESLVILLDQQGVAASMGSACSSGSLEPSRILLNMGYSRERTIRSLRFSFSRLTTQEEVDRACQIIVEQVQRLRNCSG